MAGRTGAIDVEADALATFGVLPEVPGDEAIAALTRAVELSESSGLLGIAHRAHHNLAVMIGGLLGDDLRSREHFLRAAELGHQRGVVSQELYSLVSALGLSLGFGDLEAVEDLLATIEDRLGSLPDPELMQLEISQMRAARLWMRGEREESFRLRRIWQATARKRANLQMQINLAMDQVLAWLELDREGPPVEDWREAEESMAKALEISERGIGGRVWPLSMQVVLLARQGRLDAAHQVLARVETLVDEQPTTRNQISLLEAQAELARAKGNMAGALAAVEQLAEGLDKVGRRWFWALAVREWAEIHVARGEPADLERAQTLLRKVRAAFAEMGSTFYAQRTEVRLQDLRAQTYARALAHGKAARELAVAGKIQEGLLPEEPPSVPGWQLAANLEPARETSGDFYDFVLLPGGQLGILVADVADKGAGAALFMALSRTIIRSFASEGRAQPGQVLSKANARILSETHTDMFVTVFYGVLDPETGDLTYCNAGHNPPFILAADGEATPRSLSPTGMALGVVQDVTWEQGHVRLSPGDAMVLYTDGATEAQNAAGDLFGYERLLAFAQGSTGRAAQDLLAALQTEIHAFVGTAPRSDDLTLMVIARD
jgi:serine phosphatase RsbU (regulator of sigma subunit)